ncbi:alpha/beta hydrolase [Virgibacillus sp. NKC19-3]|uniref:alpha/beta fold hydrolase n=1 Tax=Virgibacillus saliphilus TaxID=2831674 RepID=UPI001C9B68C3|nr:alpha/beta hydrolase [Virgibacillus sp. NKC19-3]MBY7141867.1 alpha/beta hydrolase [Virgibacillus sp. NKC19-3]
MEQKTLKIDGGELCYWMKTKDSNRWIIFLHGAGCTHGMFEKQISAMPDEYNIVVWDARGHGDSKLDHGRRFDYDDMIQDFIKLIDFHQMKDITIIGHSMGGTFLKAY